MGFKNILVTLDGSDLAEVALKYAEKVAAPKAHIHLLTVAVETFAQPIATPYEMNSAALMRDVNWPPLPIEDQQQALYAHENYMRRVSAWLVEEGFEVTTGIEFGDVVNTILEQAKKDTDLIVMATHGRTGLKRLTMGSVAEGVLHKAPCPVLLIPARAL